jgi:hypothetical protein
LTWKFAQVYEILTTHKKRLITIRKFKPKTAQPYQNFNNSVSKTPATDTERKSSYYKSLFFESFQNLLSEPGRQKGVTVQKQQNVTGCALRPQVKLDSAAGLTIFNDRSTSFSQLASFVTTATIDYNALMYRLIEDLRQHLWQFNRFVECRYYD